MHRIECDLGQLCHRLFTVIDEDIVNICNGGHQNISPEWIHEQIVKEIRTQSGKLECLDTIPVKGGDTNDK